MILAVYFSGCTTDHLILPDEELIINKVVTLEKSNHERLRVYNVMILGDSLVATEVRTSTRLHFHKNDILQVTEKNHLKGAIQGTLFTGLTGAGIGLLTPTMVFDQSTNIIIGLALGSMAGPIPGAIIGSKDNYIFGQNNSSMFFGDSLLLTEHATTAPAQHPVADTIDAAPKLSLSQLASIRMPEKIETIFEDLANQIAVGGYLYLGEATVDWMMAAHYRRYFKSPPATIFKQKEHDRYYVNVSLRDGGGDKEQGSDQGWSTELFVVSYGLERYRTGTLQRGITGYFEFGFVSGEKYQNYDTSEGRGFGLIAVTGVRGWSNAFIGECQIGYDTISDHFIPSGVIGLRF